jgi:hypothetical protein
MIGTPQASAFAAREGSEAGRVEFRQRRLNRFVI